MEHPLYQQAIDKLDNVLRKTDGCATTGDPDNNDWIDDCDGQNLLFPSVQRLMAAIQARI